MITVDLINNESIEVTVTDDLVTVNVIASQTIDGIIAAASQSEVNTGINDTKFVSPLTLANNTLFKGNMTDSDIQTLTDGASITVDCDSWGGRMFFLSTAESTPVLDIENFGKIAHISVKKTISGDTVATIQGTGYKFVNMDSKTLPATSVDITLSDTVNFGFEINLIDAGYTDGGDTVINVKKQ